MPDKTLFFPPRHKGLADIISIRTPKEAHVPVRGSGVASAKIEHEIKIRKGAKPFVWVKI